MTDQTVLALTGPPAAGKSTVTDMLEDMGVPCKSTGDAVRDEAARRHDDPDEDDVWDVAQSLRDEHGDAGPTVACSEWIEEQDADLICIADLRDQAEVEWLRENVGPTLVVRVDADSHARTERYVDRELDATEDRDAVAAERLDALREELYERELREAPYPDHDLTLLNEDSVSMRTIWDRLDNVTTVLTS